MAARHMRPQHSALVRWKDETQLRRPLDLEIPLIPRRRLYAKAMSLPSRDRISMLTGARRSANPAAPPSRMRCFTLASSQWAIDCSSLSSSRLSFPWPESPRALVCMLPAHAAIRIERLERGSAVTKSKGLRPASGIRRNVLVLREDVESPMNQGTPAPWASFGAGDTQLSSCSQKVVPS
ncbi:hypothetical protein IQ07DRAFT_599130 [Pyrenochaeta sp. DS3sAY3a]|nr:hypothetical protein IQ07DRAFT_599130 [Pyrenochaeta sp. DS3sAY3a]